MFTYHNPVKVVKSNNWQKAVIEHQKNLGIQKPLIVTSSGNLKRQKLSTVFNSNSIFSNVKPNPTFESCQTGIDFGHTSRFDGVIAIGGGSVMDTAKVIMASMGTGVYDVAELLKIATPYENRVPSIFIPTTHGTGSEVTMWATVWNMAKKKKYSISHTDLYPSVAILDGNLTLSMPLDISITTVMDALSHGFESIWNKNANLKSTEFAIYSICKILNNVKLLKENPSDLNTRKSLLEASTLAGLAFSNTKTAAAHSISYPLTIHYGIPHGLASSITLLPLLNINGPYIKEPLVKILEINEITYKQLVQQIKSIPTDIIPYTLKEWGVSKNQLLNLVEESFTRGRMDNNIVDLDLKSVSTILESIY